MSRVCWKVRFWGGWGRLTAGYLGPRQGCGCCDVANERSLGSGDTSHGRFSFRGAGLVLRAQANWDCTEAPGDQFSGSQRLGAPPC